MFIFANPNPARLKVEDCTVRAVSIALGLTWEQAFDGICETARRLYDMPDSDYAFGSFLKENGFERIQVPDFCPDCYTLKQFCEDNPIGTYILATNKHVTAVIDGNYYDTWDSGDEVPAYIWRRV